MDAQSQADTRALGEGGQATGVTKLGKRGAELGADGTTSSIAFPQLAEQASKVSDRIAEQIDSELTNLQATAQRAQQNLAVANACCWCPMTLGRGRRLHLFVRPAHPRHRPCPSANSGRGTFSRPIVISGPADLEHLAAQLEWLRGRLLDLAQEKNRFLRHMSHELKTPLANIREGTELLMDGAVGELQSGQREVTAILRENGMKLQRLIENLLSFSAWQAKSVGMDISEFKLRPLIKSVLENQQLTLVAQRVRLEVQVEDLTPLADRAKVRLILDNLLSNAIKFTPRGGTISIHARGERDQFILDVMDSGPGIAPAERERIFESLLPGQDPSRRPREGHRHRAGRWSPNSSMRMAAAIEILEAKSGRGAFSRALCRCARRPVASRESRRVKKLMPQ